MSTRILEFLSELDEIKFTVNLLQCKSWVNLNGIISSSEDEELLKESRIGFDDLEDSLGAAKIRQLHKIRSLCDSEIGYLTHTYTRSTIIRTHGPAYVHAIKRLNQRHPALAFFKMTKELIEDNADYQRRVKNRAGERLFKDVDGFVVTAKRLLGDNSYISIAMGLSALTGRRPSEVLLSANFKETTDREILFDDGFIEIEEGVIFSGQMKTKDAADARDNYLIPTLIDADVILSSLEKLRKFKDFSDLNCNIVDKNGRNLTPGQRINTKTASGQKKCVKKYFSENFEGSVSPYDLRHAYALICASRYCSSPNQYPKFYSKILGHKESDDLTSHSYMTLRFENQNHDN